MDKLDRLIVWLFVLLFLLLFIAYLNQGIINELESGKLGGVRGYVHWPKCHHTRWGCCSDERHIKLDPFGSNCSRFRFKKK